MRFFIPVLCAALCLGERISNSGDRFDPTSRGSSVSSGRGVSSGSSRDRDSFSNGGRASSGVTFPPFFRVEIEIERLENPKGFRSDGKDCDLTSTCDPRVKAYVDANTPLMPWPGSPNHPPTGWPILFEATDNNSPSIGKSVNRDVCGGSVSQVKLRVEVQDVDTGVNNDLIGQFECLFTVDPRDIAMDANRADWGKSIQCTGVSGSAQKGDIRLFARQRAYQITAASCQATSEGSTERVSGAAAKRQGEHDFIRVDVEVIQLQNPQGLTHKKEKCDNAGLGVECDPVVSAYLDTDKPVAAWPGSKTLPEFTQIFSVNNVNSPVINKNVSKNICGGAVSQMNLRVHIDDSDVGTNDLIEDFNCLFEADYSRVAPALSSADWSTAQDCKAQHPGHDIRLQFRYRLYDIPQSECGIKSPSSGKTSSGGGLLSGIFGRK